MIKSVTALSFCSGLFSLHYRNPRDIGRLRVPCRIRNPFNHQEASREYRHCFPCPSATDISQYRTNLPTLLRQRKMHTQCQWAHCSISSTLQRSIFRKLFAISRPAHFRNPLHSKNIIRLKDQNLALKNEETQLRREIQLTRSMTSGGLSIATDDHQQDPEPDALHGQAEIELLHKEIASLRSSWGLPQIGRCLQNETPKTSQFRQRKTSKRETKVWQTPIFSDHQNRKAL
jgi:hypothetical protein